MAVDERVSGTELGERTMSASNPGKKLTEQAGELLSEERHDGRWCEIVGLTFAGEVMQEKEES